MLCPEVWEFRAPSHRFELDVGDSTSGKPADQEVLEAADKPRNAVRAHYFNHSVSVTFPNTSSIPDSFDKNILEDSDYYRVDALCAVDLINKEFIEAFVKKGELSLLTIEKKIDLDNLAAITPSGQLILSLVRDSYQKLGIEGKPTFFDRKHHSRYVVTIDLKDEKLTPGKKYYERIYNSLDKLLDLKFNVIFSWDPPEDRICPSSVSLWFHNRGYKVTVCQQQVIRRAGYTLDIPLLENKENYDDFFEWLGLFSIDGKLINEGEEAQYVSSYVCPTPKIQVGQVQYIQITGFFTRQKIEQIYNHFKDYAFTKRESLPWCSMDVQGFDDSPVSWGMKEHGFYVDGDNSYTVVLRPKEGEYIMRKSLSSNNKPKITQ